MEDDLILKQKLKMTSIFNKIEDDLNILQNGRRPQFCTKWKTTSILYKMEDDPKKITKWKMTSIF